MTAQELLTTDFASELQSDLPDTSRVWVYLSNRPFSQAERQRLERVLAAFAASWQSHGQAVPARAGLVLDHFIVLVADDSQVGMGGCSIDASVRLLKQLEAELGVQLFERMRFAWWDGKQVRTALRDEFARLYAEGEIDDQTLVFDTLVHNLADFKKHFLKPLSASWHRRMV